MSDYLERFQATRGRRKADPELIRRWASDARYYGDANIKLQLANARRTATSMKKASTQFSNLRAEHELAINAAVSAMEALVNELVPLAAWARDYKIFCDAESKKERALELESIAAQRWGNDEKAVQFEADLMAEMGTRPGRLAFANWAHSVGKYRGIEVDQISCVVDRLAAGSTVRERAAATVKEEMKSTTPNRWEGLRGPTVICPWQDYEAYAAYRREMAQTTARIVQMASENSL